MYTEQQSFIYYIYVDIHIVYKYPGFTSLNSEVLHQNSD